MSEAKIKTALGRGGGMIVFTGQLLYYNLNSRWVNYYIIANIFYFSAIKKGPAIADPCMVLNSNRLESVVECERELFS